MMKTRNVEPEEWWAVFAGETPSKVQGPKFKVELAFAGLRREESSGRGVQHSKSNPPSLRSAAVKVQSQGNQSRMLAARGIDPPAWWTRLPAGERALIRAVVRLLRSARRSRIREVAQAAVKWERGITCFIKVRLMNERT